MNTRTITTSVLAGILVCLFFSVQGLHTGAQEKEASLPDYLPPETTFYAEVRDIQKGFKQMRDRVKKKMSEEEWKKLKENFTRLRDQLSGVIQRQLGLELGKGEELEHLTGFRMAILSHHFEVPEELGEEGDLDLPVLFQASADRVGVFEKVLEDKMSKVVKKSDRVNGYQMYDITGNVPVAREIENVESELHLLVKKRYLYFSNRKSHLKNIAKGATRGQETEEKNLAQKKKFRSALEQTSAERNMFLYVNMEQVFRDTARSLPRDGLRWYQKAEATFGFSNITSAMISGGNEADWGDFRAGLSIEGSGIPLYSALRPPAGTFQLPDMIPAEAVYVMGSQIPDGKQRYSKIKSVAKDLIKFGQDVSGQVGRSKRRGPGPGAGPEKPSVDQQWKKFKKSFKKQTGLGLKKFAKDLGGELVLFSKKAGFNDETQAMKNTGGLLRLKSADVASRLYSTFMDSPTMKKLKKEKESKTITYKDTEIQLLKPSENQKTFLSFFLLDNVFVLAGSQETARQIIDSKQSDRDLAHQEWFKDCRNRFENGLSTMYAMRQKPVVQFAIKNILKQMNLDEDRKKKIRSGMEDLKDYGYMVGTRMNDEYLYGRIVARIQPTPYGMGFLMSKMVERMEKEAARAQKRRCARNQRNLARLMKLHRKFHDTYPLSLKELADRKEDLMEKAEENDDVRNFYRDPSFVCPADTSPRTVNGVQTSYRYFPPPVVASETSGEQNLQNWILLTETHQIHSVPGLDAGHNTLRYAGQRAEWITSDNLKKTLKKQKQNASGQVESTLKKMKKKKKQMRNRSAKKEIEKKIKYLKNLREHFQSENGEDGE